MDCRGYHRCGSRRGGILYFFLWLWFDRAAFFNRTGSADNSGKIDMPAEVKKEIELEIAHVLFLDIIGYSKLSVNGQHARVDELNGIVGLSEQYQKAEAANRILKIPTGDGMALVFLKVPRNRRSVPLRSAGR